MKKITTIVVLLLIFSFMLVSIPEIGIVKAQSTIYIRADGSVEGTNKIQRDGNIYTFTGDIFDSIVVEKDDVVIEGAGYTLRGNGSEAGIRMDNTGNITVKNMEIRDFHTGIDFEATTNNTLSGNIIINNEGNGVIFHGEDNKLFGNTITNNGNYGIFLYFSHNNTISGNNITANELGIYLYGSTYNNISGNSLTTNIEAGLWFFGSSHNNIVSNNVTDNQISMHFELQCLNNTIYHNNFINNNIQFLPDFDSVSSWDNGVEGNYWSNYNGTDDNGDGIGDTPYVIAESNQDNYPLMTVIPEFPSWIILPLLMIAPLIVIIFKKKVFRCIQD